MCGIVTILSPEKKNISIPLLMRLYIDQRERGTNGYGFSYVDKKGFIKTKRFVHECECFLALASVRSWLIQFHHRNPTSTGNTVSQNHPIIAKTATAFYSMVHNGIIHNADELKKAHGKQYATEGKTDARFNDSETLLHELIATIEEKKTMKAQGSIAFTMLTGDTAGKFVGLRYGRNFSSPLYYVKYPNGFIVLSSECNIIDPKKLKGFEVPTNNIFTLTISGTKEKITGDKCVFDLYTPPIITYQSQRAWYSGKESDFMKKRRLEKENITDALGLYNDAIEQAKKLLEETETTIKASSYESDIFRALGDIVDTIDELQTASEIAYPKIKLGHTRKVRKLIELLDAEHDRIEKLKGKPIEKTTTLVSSTGSALRSFFRKENRELSALDQLAAWEQDGLC